MLKRVVGYGAERQGASHWQAIDARLNAERWQRLSAVAAQDRAEVIRGLRAAGAGSQLQRRLRYREAEAKLREALAIFQKVLGAQHPDTAQSYNDVAVDWTAAPEAMSKFLMMPRSPTTASGRAGAGQ